MGNIQKAKTKFRQTSKWKNFRKKLKEEQKIDYLTGSKLYKGFNCHHLDLNPNHYEDTSDPNKYICLNKKTHDTIHFIWNIYQKDPKVINRIEDIMKRMAEINKKELTKLD